MTSWLKPLIIGFLGAGLAFGGYMGYQLVQEHRALMTWAGQVNQWVQAQQRTPLEQKLEQGKPPVAKESKK